MANNLTPKEEFLLNPVTEHNITDAAIASFETNLRHGVKVEVPFAPKQDLHGYDHPWPAGGGKNLVNPNGLTNERYNSVGTVYSNDTGVLTTFLPVAPGETYTVSFNQGMYSIQLIQFDAEKTWIKNSNTSYRNNYTIRLESTTAYVRLTGILDNTSVMQVETFISTYHPQLELGSTATAYAPYENICPISGWTECEIEHVWENYYKPNAPFGVQYNTSPNKSMDLNCLVPGVWQYNLAYYNPPVVTVTLTKNGFKFVSSDLRYLIGYCIKVKPGTRLYVNFDGSTNVKVVLYTKQWEYLNIIKHNCKGVEYIIPDNVYYCEIIFGAAGINVETSIENLIISVAGQSDNFENYGSTTLPISWKHAEGTYEFSPVQEGSGDPSPENVRPIHPALTITRDDNTELTVYGGSITFNDDGTSRVISDTATYTVTGADSEYWNLYNNDKARFYSFDGVIGQMRACSSTECICNMFISGSGYNPVKGAASITRSGSATYVAFRDIEFFGSTASEMRAKAAELYENGTPIVVAGKLIEPVTYTLSITETQRAIEALGDKVTTTIYGGTVTINEDGSADVVDTHKYVEYDGVNNAFTYSVGAAYRATFSEKGVNTGNTPSDKLYCNSYNPVQTAQAGNCYVSGGGSFFFVYPTTAYESLEDFNASLIGNPIIIAYQLVTPQSYHFPNVGKLKAFLGTNNIWSDIGNVNVKYLTQNSETGMEYRGDRALELRRRAMMADAPTIHTTVGSEETGGLASFKSYVKAPVKKIEIPFGPKQDLHGYDHPWPTGGGKNLFPYSSYTAQAFNELVSRDTYPEIWDMATKLEPGSSYRTNCTGYNNFNINIYYSDGSHCYISKANQTDSIKDLSDGTITIDNIRIQVGVSSDTNPRTATNCCLEKGTTTPEYSPYENECPIEGHDGCDIYHNAILELQKDPITNDGITYTFLDRHTVSVSGMSSSIAGTGLTQAYVAETNKIYIDCNTGISNLKVYLWDQTTKTNISGTVTKLQGVYNVTVGHEYVVGARPNNANLNCTCVFTCIASKYPLTSTLPLIFNQAGDHAFLPIQEGTGDPSPENERPIHPGLTFTRDDDSVLSVYGGSLTVNADGTGSISSKWGSLYLTGEEDSSKYCCHTDGRGYISSYSDATLFKRSDIIISGVAFLSDKFSESKDGSFKSFPPYTGSFYSNNLFFRLFDDYQPHSVDEIKAEIVRIGGVHFYGLLVTPITYTLSVAETNRALEALGLSQHIGTIYGGTVTLNEDGSVDLVSSYFLFDIGTLTYSQYRDRICWTGQIPNARKLASTTDNTVLLACNKYAVIKPRSILDNGINKRVWMYGSANNARLVIRDEDFIVNGSYNTTALKESLSGTYICIAMSTPKTYHFTNLEELKVWLGENNFWCDISDDISVKYWNRGFGN